MQMGSKEELETLTIFFFLFCRLCVRVIQCCNFPFVLFLFPRKKRIPREARNSDENSVQTLSWILIQSFKISLSLFNSTLRIELFLIGL